MIATNERAQVSLQERDLAVIKDLFESRIMSLAHVAVLHFGGSQEAAKKRIQKLKSAGFVSERPRRAYEKSILFLTRKAFELLEANGVLKEYRATPVSALEKRAKVSELTVRHELEVMDVKAAFAKAISDKPNLKIVEFSTWPRLSEFTAYPSHGDRKGVIVRPDGFIRLREQDKAGEFEHSFFLEVDRSTETQDTLAMKAACYADYYRRGGFASRQGATAEEYKDFPFRVLVVCKTAERRDNAAERMLKLNPPILTQVMLSTFKEATADPFGRIWVRPIDYRDAARGSTFDRVPEAVRKDYRSETEREKFVERTILKQPLFGEN